MTTYQDTLPQPETNRFFPVTALVFAILAVVLSFFNGWGYIFAFPALVFSILGTSHRKGRSLSFIALSISILSLLLSTVITLIIYFTPGTATLEEHTYYEETIAASMDLAHEIDTFLLSPDEENLDALSNSLDTMAAIAPPKEHERTQDVLKIYLNTIKVSGESLYRNEALLYKEAHRINNARESILTLLDKEMNAASLKKEANALGGERYAIDQQRLLTYLKAFISASNEEDISRLEAIAFLADSAGLSAYYATDIMGNITSPFEELITAYKEWELADTLGDDTLKEAAKAKIEKAKNQLGNHQKELEASL